MTERLDLDATRNTTWRPVIELYYRGDPLPLKDATIRIQWRLYPGAPGAPLIDLPLLHHADLSTPTALEPDGRTLSLYPEAEQEDVAGLPSGLNQPEPGEADRFAWDAVILYADGVEEQILEGYVFVTHGVVRNA